ncbi:hypothetical protein BGZ73_004072 [Actinomortierella ambigua]|nr:hypothetical protein BGZ73_004072 [Actinomortierella ambigua]
MSSIPLSEASDTLVEDTYPKAAKKEAMLEQQRNRQQHLQRLSIPYVQAIRQKQQQHAQETHGELVPSQQSQRPQQSSKTVRAVLPSIDEGSDGFSVVPDLLRTPPARLSIAERLKRGSQRIRSHGALAAAIAHHSSEDQGYEQVMLDGMTSPLGGSLLPTSLSQEQQAPISSTLDSDGQTAVATATDQTVSGAPTSTERGWSRVFKIIAGGSSELGGTGGGAVRIGIGREGTQGHSKRKESCGDVGSQSALHDRLRYQVDSGSLASFRGLDASPTLRVMNPDHGDNFDMDDMNDINDTDDTDDT